MKNKLKYISIFLVAIAAVLAITACIEPYDFEKYEEEAEEATEALVWHRGLSEFIVRQGQFPGTISYLFNGTMPAADSYRLYFREGNADLNSVISGGQSIRVNPGSGTLSGLAHDTLYSLVIVADRRELPRITSNVEKVRTMSVDGMLVPNIEVKEIGVDTIVVNWFFTLDGEKALPTSDITLSYSYSGLGIRGGKLTPNIITEKATIEFSNNRHSDYLYEYIITTRGLIIESDVVISTEYGGQEVVSMPHRTQENLELKLYNIALEKAREYGAIEMFSYGWGAADNMTVIPIIATATNIRTSARAHTIINYQNGIPKELYGATFSRGQASGTLASFATNAATQLREWYYNGTTLYGRSNGGLSLGGASAESLVTGGTGATAAVIPTASWNSVTSIDDAHDTIWSDFHSRFRQDPFKYIVYDVNEAYDGLYEYWYPDPSAAGVNADMSQGRETAPIGFLNATPGALAHNVNGDGYFRFTIQMIPDLTGNGPNIPWSGNVTFNTYIHSSITFVIDEDMKFVKYHAYDRYSVTSGLSSYVVTPNNNTAATTYFVYHQNNIDLNNHTIYRPHQTDGPGTVIDNSGYDINLGWLGTASTVSIP